MLDVWYALSAPPLPPCLDAHEHARGARLLHAQAQAAYVAAHTFKRHVLSTYDPARPPGAWRFDHSPLGKPSVAGGFLHGFNLSHSGACVAVAVGRADVGVDIERHRHLEDAQALARLVFHPREQRWWGDQGHSMPAFFRLWTLKEALLKAAGCGFSQPATRVGWERLDAPWPVAWLLGRRWWGASADLGTATLAVAQAIPGDAGGGLTVTGAGAPAQAPRVMQVLPDADPSLSILRWREAAWECLSRTDCHRS